MVRFEGPIVRQNQGLFAGDWEAETGENLKKTLLEPVKLLEDGFPALVIATGPTVQYQAMPEMFESLMYSARRNLTISTPYYVPDEPMQTALCASARRGVETTIIFPRRNDSRFVGAASRSYYRELLDAGVRIFEFTEGLLHAKTLTVDGEVALVGSANMDRRSFELNYENNIMFYSPSLTADLYKRQIEYIADSTEVTLEMVDEWSTCRRLINNLAAIFGPVL
jgi:cardiolipin synthase